jgi:hypothetical protein
MRVALDHPQEDHRRALRAAVAGLQGFTGPYDHVPRAAKAMALVALSGTRDDKFEHVRRTIQAARDGVRKVRPSFYPVDIPAGVTSDVNAIGLDPKSKSHLARFVLPPESSASNAWLLLTKHMKFYDQAWEPWIGWLKYRLFGSIDPEFEPETWEEAESIVSRVAETKWQSVPTLNAEFARILSGALDQAGRLEPQNASGIMFDLNAEDRLDVSDRDYSRIKLGDLTALFGDLTATLDRLIELCSDNSSARLRERAVAYRDALKSLGVSGMKILFIARGDALRKELTLQRSLRDSTDPIDSDVSQVRDSVYLGLDDCVTKHNLFVNKNTELADLDRMCSGPETASDMLGPSELKRMVQHPTTNTAISERAIGAIEEIADAAPAIPTTDDRGSIRASESGKNLVRKAMEVLARHKGKAVAAPVAATASLYAIGHWALANEQMLLGYFENNPGMQRAMATIFEWLHTLPLA